MNYHHVGMNAPRLALFALYGLALSFFLILSQSSPALAQGQQLSSTIAPGTSANSLQGPPGFGTTIGPPPFGANNLSTAIGFNASSTFASAAYGANAKSGDKATAIGSGAQAVGSANALGFGSNAGAQNSLALGNQTMASQVGSTAIGHKASATALNSTALGISSSASAANSVALGANSAATLANTVSIGTVGGERRLVNLAPGVAGTDGVDLNQLNNAISGLSPSNTVQATSAAPSAIGQAIAYTDQRVNQANAYTTAVYQNLSHDDSALSNRIDNLTSNSYRGIACANALVSAPRPLPGKSGIALGTGYYMGNAATALTMAHTGREGHWQSSFGVATSVTGNNGANLAGGGGVLFQF